MSFSIPLSNYCLILLAIGGNWPGYPVEEDGDGEVTVFPQSLEVDYVRVYDDSFPRIVGKSVVECSEKSVQYEVVNIDEEGMSFFWTLPQGAKLKSGQGTNLIFVDYDTEMKNGNNINNDVIRVQANGIEQSIATSIGLAKLQEGLGLRIKVTDFDGKCSATTSEKSGLKRYDFDCGRPATCTPFVLHKTTEEYTLSLIHI